MPCASERKGIDPDAPHHDRDRRHDTCEPRRKLRRRIVKTPNCYAKSGTSGVKAKKGALPEPIMTEETEMKATIMIA